MNNRNRILVSSILIMATGMLCASGITLTILYRAACEEERTHLVEIARGQARVIEAVARFDAIHSRDDHPDGARAATLSQIADAHERHPGFGETGELVLARRERDQIVFLFPFRHGRGGDPDPIAWASELAEPMRLALSGQEGAVIGLDYRGEPVLAAHAPVAVLNLGVVAKMDLAELRAPFVRAGVIAGGVTLLLVVVGAGLTLRVADPLVRKLQESEACYAQAERTGQFGNWERDFITGQGYWSAGTFRILGLDPVESPPSHSAALDLVHPGDRDLVKSALNTALTCHKPLDVKCRIIRPDGTERFVHVLGKVRFGESGQAERLVGTLLDITERRRPEESRRQSQQQYRTLVESAPLAVYETDAQGKCLYVNERWRQLTGLTLEQALGDGWREGLHEEDRARLSRLWSQHVRDQKPWDMEYRFRTPDGKVSWVMGRATAIRDADGQVTGYLGANVDISERKRAEERLAQTTNTLNSILASATEYAIAATDLDFRIIHYNPAAERLFGYKSEGVIGRTVTEMHTQYKVDPERFERAIEAVAREGKWEYGLELDGPAGERRVVQAVVMPMCGEEGACTGYILFACDITERKRIEEELHRARAAAEASDKAKSEFLANMSHEIRTPMNAIIGYADLLWRVGDLSQAPEQQKEAVLAIRGSGRHLLNLINDILDLSRIESGKVQMEIADCDPWGVVADVVSTLNVRAAKQKIELAAEITEEIPQTIRTDAGRLRQCLTNLVGNAVKFTSEGGVQISVGMAGSSKEPTIRFDVCDTGIGIHRDRMEAIFEPFTQADESTSRQFGGTGLGLAISRQIARGLGGDIAARSVEGKGSTFTLEVPASSLEGVQMRDRLTVQATAPSEPVPQAEAPELHGRILVVEDSTVNRDMLVAMLSDLDLEIATVENGLAAVEAVKNEVFDLILMDWQMPVMDGLEATRRVRATGNEVPIIALTANAMRGDREKCFQAGCTGYLSKPVDYDDLLGELKKYLAHVQQVRTMNVGHAQ